MYEWKIIFIFLEFLNSYACVRVSEIINTSVTENQFFFKFL